MPEACVDTVPRGFVANFRRATSFIEIDNFLSNFFSLSLIYFYFIFRYYGFFNYSMNNINLLIALKCFDNLFKKIEWIFRRKIYVRNFICK